MSVDSVNLSLSVTGIGAVTPVGHTVEESCAAIRAGLSGYRDHPFFGVETPDPEWDAPEMLTAAMIQEWDDQVEGPARLVQLGLEALRELLRRRRIRRAELDDTALLLALPVADDVVSTWQLSSLYATVLCERAGLPPFAVQRIEQSGQVSVFHLLREATVLLGARQCARCILLAVDTYHDERRLELLDRGYRVRSERAVDGFIPGEAAVAMMLEAPGPNAILDIERYAAAAEPQPYTSDLSSTGRGLQQVLESLLDGQPMPRPWLVCDMNGESYRAYEWGLMLSRLSPRLDALRRLDHPAESVGDTGSAAGAVLLAHAAQAFVRGYAPEDKAILWAASDSGSRAGIVVSRPRT